VCVCVCQCISSQSTEAHGRFLCVLAIKGEKKKKKFKKGGSITWGEGGVSERRDEEVGWGVDRFGGGGWGVCRE